MSDSQWQRNAAQRAWLASTRRVGRLVGAGLFVLSALRLVMMVPWLSSGVATFIVRSPFIGETIGGGLIALGWFVILGKQPRRDQRVLGIVGMLASVALALSGAKSIAAEDLFAAFTAQTTVWLEIAVTATALVGASMWGGVSHADHHAARVGRHRDDDVHRRAGGPAGLRARPAVVRAGPGRDLGVRRRIRAHDARAAA